ncbi:MAG: helix-turn-helix transcriptional regulator [Halobacteriales archaeon]
MAGPGRVVGTLLILLVAVGAGGGAGASASGAPGLFVIGDQFDRVQFRITVFENASAEWVFHYERVLENDTETQNYRDFAERFNEQETDLFSDFKTQARALARDGGDATGRNMTATQFSKRAYVSPGLDNDIGVVEMTFQWGAFAEQQGETIVVADIFEGGLYIDSGQSLVFMTGPDLQFRAVEPRDSAILSDQTLSGSDSVTWQGERSFSDNHPRVVIGPETPTPTATPTPRVDTTTSEPVTETPTVAPSTPRTPINASGSDSAGEPPWALFFGIGLVAILGAILVWRYTDTFGGDGTPSIGDDDGADGGPSGGVTTEANGGSTTASPGEPAVTDAELLSDEDRVQNLLREHGGRMRQSQIVDETGWSKSKVSMLLSDMDEEETINKLRIGRENIITLPGHEPEAMSSPHEEVENDPATNE